METTTTTKQSRTLNKTCNLVSKKKTLAQDVAREKTTSHGFEHKMYDSLPCATNCARTVEQMTAPRPTHSLIQTSNLKQGNRGTCRPGQVRANWENPPMGKSLQKQTGTPRETKNIGKNIGTRVQVLHFHLALFCITWQWRKYTVSSKSAL